MRHYTEDELYLYIVGGTYPENIRKEIGEHLKKCLECYKFYIELKEIKYFQTQGEDMPQEILENAMNLVGQKKELRCLSLIIYYTKKTVRVFSEDNFELKTNFLDISYATRNGKELVNNNDAFMLQKTIGEYNVLLHLSRLPDNNHFNLKVDLKKKNKLAKKTLVYLKENGQEIEFIEIGRQERFAYKLEANIYDLYFQKDGEELFSISMKLKSED